MATTIAELVEIVRADYLQAGQRPERNKLSGTITDTAGTLILSYDANVAEGHVISIGFEDMGVWVYDPTTRTATVERGDLQSTAAAHTAADVVSINAPYSDWRILRSVINVCNELRIDPTLYKQTVETFTYVAGQDLYPLTTEDADVYRVLAETPDPDAAWWPLSRFEVIHDTTGVSTSPSTLVIHDSAWSGYSVKAQLKAPLGVPDATTADIETTVGVSADLIAVGAALRLTRGRSIRRTEMGYQTDARRSNEVAPFSTAASIRPLEDQYERLLARERMRLYDEQPLRIRR